MVVADESEAGLRVAAGVARDGRSVMAGVGDMEGVMLSPVPSVMAVGVMLSPVPSV